MKISGGLYRGRRLRVPRGVRPTEARVREALFSIWADRVEGARFADLFAGSGAVGVEALSRGAVESVLIEKSGRVFRDLKENCGFVEKGARLVRAALPERLAPDLLAGGLVDLVFADPPYVFDDWERLLVRMPPLLREDAEVAVEHSARQEVPREVGGLRAHDRRVYGESALTFYAAS